MIGRTFERNFILKFTGIVLAGFGLMIWGLYMAIPRGDIREYGEAIRSYLEADIAVDRAIIMSYVIESIIAPVIVILIAVFASHKIAGPVYRLKVALQELIMLRKTRPVGFRSYDQVHETAAHFNAMLDGLHERFRVIDEACRDAAETIEKTDDTPEGAALIKEKVAAVGKAVDGFIH